jgi:hypothetical protein
LKRRVLLFAALLVVLVVCTDAMPVLAEPSFEECLDSFGFTSRSLVSIETFPKGTYEVTLYAEWAGYRDDNLLRWYRTGTSDFNVIFSGSDGVPVGQPMGSVTPPQIKSFVADGQFGLSLKSPDGTEYSETVRNPDGRQHMKIYQSGGDPNLYFIGFENMNYPNSDFDFNDMIFSLRHVQAYLTVNSLYDLPDPTSGSYDVGTDILAYVSSPIPGPTGTRYVCTGWTGTGSVPASGSSPAVSFTLTQDSSITWNWKTQHLLTVVTDPAGLSPSPSRSPAGEAEPPNGWWFDDGQSVVLSSSPVAGFEFAYWDVDGGSQGAGVSVITVDMSASHAATSHYLPLFDLVIMTTGEGTTNPAPGSYSYVSGFSTDVKGLAQNGFILHHWELDGVNVGSGSPQSVLMNSGHTLKAVFTAIPVGGEWVAFDKYAFVMPMLEWASLMLLSTALFVCVRRRKRRSN